MTTPPPLAVLWDMDGTLADSEPMHGRTLAAVLASLGARYDAEVEAATLGKAEREVHAVCAARFGLAISFDAWALSRARSYIAMTAQLPARPGALGIYRALQRRGTKQAIVSNASRMILDANLRALDLHEPTLTSVSINDVRRGKPDAEPYQRAAWLLGVAPGEAWVIEDSPIGAASGLAAGMRVIAWPHADAPVEAFPAGAQIVRSAEELARSLSVPLEPV